MTGGVLRTAAEEEHGTAGSPRVGWRDAIATRISASLRPIRVTPSDAVAARAFYCDVLGGRQVWPARRVASCRSLWFRIGEALVEVRPDCADAPSPLELLVNDPLDLAEQCWDAGFTIQVNEGRTGEMLLSTFDPFGRRIDLVQRLHEALTRCCG